MTAAPNPKDVDAVASAFSNAISDAVKAKSVAKSAEQIADEIVASYPFHPSFKHILALFKDNERFRQTRGLMTLAAMMVRSVQGRRLNDVYLIGCQHLDLSIQDIRDGVTNIYDLSGAIAHDIAGTGNERGHAQVIDEQMQSDAASQVASLLLMASLPEANGAVKGLTQPQIVENLVATATLRNRIRRRLRQAQDRMLVPAQAGERGLGLLAQREPAEEDREIRRRRPATQDRRRNGAAAPGDLRAAAPDRLLGRPGVAETERHQDQRRTRPTGPEPRQDASRRTRPSGSSMLSPRRTTSAS